MQPLIGPLLGSLGPRILRELTQYIAKSLDLQVQNVDDEAIVRDTHPPSSIPGERVYRVMRESCESGEAVSTGLPCPHFICGYRELSNGGFPAFLIQRRWFIEGRLPILWRKR
jgi:hypothetical protein